MSAEQRTSEQLYEVKSRLIQHAAALATGKLLPQIDTDHWYATTPLAERRLITKAMNETADRHKGIALSIRELADSL
jgi:hypothetical protein